MLFLKINIYIIYDFYYVDLDMIRNEWITYESINEVWIIFANNHGVNVILFIYITTFMHNQAS